MKRTDIPVALATLALATAAASCGGDTATSNQSGTSRSHSVQDSANDAPVGGALDTSPTTVQPAKPTVEAPPSKPGPTVKADPERERQRSGEVPASDETAPRGALRLARTAAVAWLRYRVNGEIPDTDVVPRSVRGTIPPMTPQLRQQGAARLSGVTVFDAHPERDDWTVVVALSDARMPQLALLVRREGDGYTVARVTEGGA